MNGGSLGLRSSSSYGSLQSNNSPFAFLSVNSVPGSTGPNGRKFNSKVLLAGSREKERRLSSVWKIASRRKIGMFMLVIASAAVLLSFFFTLSRDVDQPIGPENIVGYSDHIWKLVNHGMTTNYISSPSAFSEQADTAAAIMSNIQNSKVNNRTKLPFAFVHSIEVPSQHPCDNFSPPPPIADPKRTGPRPCEVCYVPEDTAIGYMPAFQSMSPILKNLDYVSEEKLLANESNGGSSFGGHPSLVQRELSYDIKESMTLHCGLGKQVTGAVLRVSTLKMTKTSRRLYILFSYMYWVSAAVFG